MTVSVPYVQGMLHERTEEWAQRQGAKLVGMDLRDNRNYWRWLAGEWTVDADTVVVEHDIVPAAGVVEEMLACPQPWCVSPYPIAIGYLLTEGLGCTKFSAGLKAQHIDVLTSAGLIDDDGQPRYTWRRLDTRIARVLTRLGFRPHEHAPSEHLHDYRARP